MRERLKKKAKNKVKDAIAFGTTAAVAVPLCTLVCFCWWLSHHKEPQYYDSYYYGRR